MQQPSARRTIHPRQDEETSPGTHNYTPEQSEQRARSHDPDQQLLPLLAYPNYGEILLPT